MDPVQVERRYDRAIKRRLERARKAVVAREQNWKESVEKALSLRSDRHERIVADSFGRWLKSEPDEVRDALSCLWDRSRQQEGIEAFKNALPPTIPVRLHDRLVAMLLGLNTLRRDPSEDSETDRNSIEGQIPGDGEPVSQQVANPQEVRLRAQPQRGSQTHGHHDREGSDPLAADEASAQGQQFDRIDSLTASRAVPIEAYIAEAFQSDPSGEPTMFERREAALVQRYVDWLAQFGRHAVRHEIRLPGSERPLYTDVYDLSSRELVEAKASSGRVHIRMAIGQLMDYSRYVSHDHLAVLTPTKPHPDLVELLDSLEINCIYEVQNGVFIRAEPNQVGVAPNRRRSDV
jgi:hypothetical protein